ncbi:MAG: hypothetical protein RL026_1829 [Pseudomonadota bacterium]
MNLNAKNANWVVGAALICAAAPASAVQMGPLEIAGFLKYESSTCDNCSLGPVNPSPFDPRGALTTLNPPLNQGGESGRVASDLSLAMLTVAYTHEFDNAVKLEARVTGRGRDGGADIYGHYLNDGYVGISYPTLGSLQVGKMTTRSWTRSDSFSYPMGLSSPWAESGAGYGLLPYAVRVATPEYEIPVGKLRFELTAGGAESRPPLNPSSQTVAPPNPRMLEAFVQFSNEKNLVEFIYQGSRGGRQSAFSKGAFYGAQGNTNSAAASPAYQRPSESLVLLQGSYWATPQWRISYGLKRSDWSGQQQQCDYGQVSPIEFACFWDQGGFNYATDGRRYSARTTDYMAGVSHVRRLWTYTLGMVQLSEGTTANPTEWGQENSARFINLGVYRKMPELYKDLEFYAGLGHVRFGRQGPAPLSMPNNTAFFGADPRTSRSAQGLTLGVNLKF